MRLKDFSPEAQDGLRKWAGDVMSDELFFDAISGNPESWAWVWFRLRESEDKPEWFPKGKWATLQALETRLIGEAKLSFG